MLIPLCVIIVCMYIVQKRWLLAQNESQRIDGITKGPINTKLGSAVDGLNSIRAYSKIKHWAITLILLKIFNLILTMLIILLVMYFSIFLIVLIRVRDKKFVIFIFFKNSNFILEYEKAKIIKFYPIFII